MMLLLLWEDGEQTEEFRAKATALWDTCTDCDLCRDLISHPYHLWSVHEIIRERVTDGCEN